MRGTYSPQEAVNIALGQVDAKVSNGLSPIQAMGEVAQENNLTYEKLETLYIDRGVASANA
jgi:hypothetical protein